MSYWNRGRDSVVRYLVRILCFLVMSSANHTFRCQTSASGTTGSFSSGTGVTTNGLSEWQVVSHEVCASSYIALIVVETVYQIGHNFGAIVSYVPYNVQSIHSLFMLSTTVLMVVTPPLCVVL